MGFDIYYRKPPVERLAFHLEYQQQVLFHDDDDFYDVVNNPTVKQTVFTEWMRTNDLYPEARKLTYVEFPMEWVWCPGERMWKKREWGFKIGRIYYAHPLSGERFYMCMLLNTQRGSRTFLEIKTIRGHVYDDYKSSCLALGLLEDDNEWRNVILEVAASAGSAQLRHLFLMLILFSEVSDPLRLWNEHWELFADDIVRAEILQSENGSSSLTPEELQNRVLIEIEKLMNRNNRSLKEIPSMSFPQMTNMARRGNHLLAEDLGYDSQQLHSQYDTMFATLNPEQYHAFNDIIESVLYRKSGAFFLHGGGGGGTGKTYLWNTIITYLSPIGKIVLLVASSGIASLLFPGGRTTHSRFKIPMTTDDITHCNISKGSHLAELICKLDLIIWDQAPMSHRHDFETVDRTFRDLMTYDGNDAREKLFGGKTFAFGGDFRQILHVIVKGKWAAIVGACIRVSYIWDHCRLLYLRSNMRLVPDSPNVSLHQLAVSYQDWILAVGEGKVEGIFASDGADPNWISIPSDLLIPTTTNNIASVISFVYPELRQSSSNIPYFQERCILAPTNETVDAINDVVLNLFPGTTREYLSADSISPNTEFMAGQDIMYPPEVLHQMSMTGMLNHMLRLKVGVPIMMLRNIDQSRGLCNGTRLVVTMLEDDVIQAEIITGNNVGNKELIPRIVMTTTRTNRWHVALRRVQYPIKVCLAMTINNR